jgi:electron transfer flavoprotein beta subunit
VTEIDLYLCTRPIAVLEDSAPLNSDGNSLNPSAIRWVVDPCNASALEMALQLRESGHVARVICLTVGPEEFEQNLAYCMATGANQVMRLDCSDLHEMDARQVGALLARMILQFGGKLVMAGQRSGDEQIGLVAAAVAKDIGAAYLSNVAKIEIHESEVKIARKIERGHQQLCSADLPAVLAVDAGVNQPRYVSVASLLMSRRSPVKVLALGDVVLAADELPRLTERVRLMRGRVRARSSMIPGAGGSASDRLLAITGKGSESSSKKVLTGTADELALEAVSFMEKRGLLIVPED